MKRWRSVSIAVLAACATGAQAASHVFLVQNSGWMEPFYTDPESPGAIAVCTTSATSAL